jgi:putative transposase
MLLAAPSRLLPREHWGAFFLTPATLLRWHQDLVASRWTYPRRRPGRPSTRHDVRELILRMARANPTWGPPPDPRQAARARPQGRGQHRVVHPAASHDRARPRRAAQSWRQFLTTQAATILACDFFTVETVFLRRIYVFFVLKLATCRVHVAGATRYRTGRWVAQQARNFLMDLEDRAVSFRFLIRERDAKFTTVFDGAFTAVGTEVIKTPSQAPRANCYAERWVGTVRRECTDRLLILGERHLVAVLDAYVQHYNNHRPHRCLQQRPPVPAFIPPGPTSRPVRRHQILGGLTAR